VSQGAQDILQFCPKNPVLQDVHNPSPVFEQFAFPPVELQAQGVAQVVP